MAGLCYVTTVTGHKAYTGKEEEEEYIDIHTFDCSNTAACMLCAVQLTFVRAGWSIAQPQTVLRHP
jgi:hypothetical protein